MLEIDLTVSELYDDESDSFVNETVKVCLEHTLLTLSKWEAKYKKPFLSGKDDKTEEEMLDYISMMVVSDNADDLFRYLTPTDLKTIVEYISEDKQTATWFSEDMMPSKPTAPKRKEVITSEVVYYMMFANGIPIECERWNLNRLFTLLRVFSEKQKEQDPNRKKMSQAELAARHRAINEANRKRLRTKG